jgi:membrane-anchored protein YejM (alkaline phosphatase superfamily)
VPPRARLRFAIGVDESAWSPDLPAVEFELTAIADADAHVLFTARLDPARRPEERHWFDQEIDLDTYAGQQVRLRFATRSLGARRAPFAYGVWSDPTIVVPTSAEAAAPRNLVLISLDTLRADRLGAYGYARPTSPEIDHRLAAQGTVFTHAYSTYPGTGGSHASILTGLYPCAVVPDLAQPIHPRAATLAELLRAAGYETAAFTEDGYVIAAHGFARGFGSFVEGTSALVTEPTGQADKTFARALDWVRARRAPWFAFLHTYQVHYPYAPPPGYLERVLGSGPADTSDSARYDAEIRYTDELLAKFLAGLDQLGATQNTLVVLLADHGEQFGEHGLTLHGNSLYDELLHVPLIMRAPGLVPAGLRADMPVDMTDVMPTVLDLLQLPPAQWTNGRSLVPLLRGASLPDRPLYASLVFTRQVAVRVPPTKWIIDQATGRVHSYDLHGDARELRDLGASSPAIGSELLARYRAACDTLPASDIPAAPTLDPAVKDKLKALGYVD